MILLERLRQTPNEMSRVVAAAATAAALVADDDDNSCNLEIKFAMQH